MSFLGWAAATAGLTYTVVIAFQVALAAGAPWGRASYGGAPDRLPRRLRVTSAVAALVWVAAVLVVLRRAGVPVPAPLPDGALPLACWVLTALLGVGLLLNLVTRSRVERAVWAPVSAVALAATVAVNLLGR